MNLESQHRYMDHVLNMKVEWKSESLCLFSLRITTNVVLSSVLIATFSKVQSLA